MTQNIPNLTYRVAWMDDKNEVEGIFEMLKAHNVTRLDTARAYKGSEQLIAKAGVARDFTITTKAMCGFCISRGKKEFILEDAKQSFEALGIDKVDVYLLHAPDISVALGETLDTIQELYIQGRFDKFGLSNFTADQVQEAYDYSKSKNHVLPTVYQSNYNLLGRKNETLLFPTLRKLGISIQAYSPIAGGFLTKTPEQIAETRWDSHNWIGSFFAIVYGRKPSFLTYLREFGELSENAKLSKVAIAYRWLRYHSDLKGEDSVTIGARSVGELEEILQQLDKGPLEPWIVDKLDEIWKKVECDVVHFHTTVNTVDGLAAAQKVLFGM